MQLNHYNTTFKIQSFPIIIVSENVSNAPNIGSLFRICDAFGVEKLILCGENISLNKKMTKTSRATEKAVSYEFNSSAVEVVNSFKNKGYQIISLEITSKSHPLHTYQFSNKKPMLLVVGDENFGVSEAILNISDDVIHITMFGQNSSMNVVQATNIILYEITKQFL